MSGITQKHNDKQKKKAVGMLKALIRRIESGEFIVESSGWWLSRLAHGATFKVNVVIRDEGKTSKDFSEFS